MELNVMGLTQGAEGNQTGKIRCSLKNTRYLEKVKSVVRSEKKPSPKDQAA